MKYFMIGMCLSTTHLKQLWQNVGWDTAPWLLAQDNSISPCSPCHSWRVPDAWDATLSTKCEQCKQGLCCNFGTPTLPGVLVYQWLSSLLLLFQYRLLIVGKKKSKTFSCNPTKFTSYQHLLKSPEYRSFALLLLCDHTTLLLQSCHFRMWYSLAMTYLSVFWGIKI